MPSDLQHLQRYATTGDAHAFRELVQAHGAMVHATALRVTRDAGAAQDVAQETFLELARKASGITQSVAAWLHRVAWNRACDAVRRESTRKRFEEAMAGTWHSDREATWPDIEPHVDASLNELPNELREVLVLYFFEGRTQAEVARHLGKNQATVSRAIERGISAMREALRSRGVIAGAGLAALFTAQSVQAMPVAVQASLGKLCLTGISTTTAITPAASVISTTLITMTATTKVLLVTGTLAAFSLPFVIHRPEPKPIPASPPSVVKNSPTKPKATFKGPEISDEEAFNLMFGGDLDKGRQAHALVEEYRAQHRGSTLMEALKQDADIGAKTAEIMQMMARNPKQFKVLWEATQFAMQMKGIKPSPQTQVKLQLDDAFMQTEAEAERFLGAVLSKDPDALAEVFSNVINSAAVEMALDPGADETSTGVSINKDPLPPGTKIIQKEPED
jgi:RNA polymerase sigma factor (sigma-70 family)